MKVPMSAKGFSAGLPSGSTDVSHGRRLSTPISFRRRSWMRLTAGSTASSTASWNRTQSSGVYANRFFSWWAKSRKLSNPALRADCWRRSYIWSKMPAISSRFSMYGLARSLNARSRTARSDDSRNGRSCEGVFSSPSHWTVMAPISFDHSVVSLESCANTGTLASLKICIWFRKRSTIVSRPGRT